MTWDQELEKRAEHYANLAMQPGWWDYATQQVMAMESEQGGHWLGLRDAVRSKLQSANFALPKTERWPPGWWLDMTGLKAQFASQWLERHPSTGQRSPQPASTAITSNAMKRRR